MRRRWRRGNGDGGEMGGVSVAPGGHGAGWKYKQSLEEIQTVIPQKYRGRRNTREIQEKYKRRIHGELVVRLGGNGGWRRIEYY